MPRVCWEEQLCVSCEFVTKFAVYGFFAEHTELYSHLHEELELRLKEAERVGYGFDLPKIVVAPNAPKISITKSAVEIAA